MLKQSRYSNNFSAIPYIDANNIGCGVAIAAAKLSDHQFKLGAAITKGKRVISIGANQSKKTHPIFIQRNKYNTYCIKIHAEVACILKARQDIRGCKIFVARVNNHGLSMAMPCILCRGFIKESGIREIIYTDLQGNWMVEKL